jgi:hypothetical protein
MNVGDDEGVGSNEAQNLQGAWDFDFFGGEVDQGDAIDDERDEEDQKERGH